MSVTFNSENWKAQVQLSLVDGIGIAGPLVQLCVERTVFVQIKHMFQSSAKYSI